MRQRFIDTKGTSTTMYNKDKIIFDKKPPFEYNIGLYILEELCDTGVIDVIKMTKP